MARKEHGHEPPDSYVWVRPTWSDVHLASFHIADVADPEWFVICAGIFEKVPRAFLHAHVQLADLQEGNLRSSNPLIAGGDQVEICILQRDNSVEVFMALAEKAGPPPLPPNPIPPALHPA